MEWVYAKDAASATVGALTSVNLKSRIFNVTMGRLTSPEEFAAAITAAVPGARVRIETPTDKTVALQTMLRASISASPANASASCRVSTWRGGVLDMVAWCRANELPRRG